MAAAKKPRPTNHFRLTVGGKEAAGQFREVTGLDAENEIVEEKHTNAQGMVEIMKVPGGMNSTLAPSASPTARPIRHPR